MTFSHSAEHQWCNKKLGKLSHNFWRKKKFGLILNQLHCTWKMTSADKVCLCLSHLSGSLIKTIKKSFQKKGEEQKHEKKGENVAWFNLLVSFVYLFLFYCRLPFVLCFPASIFRIPVPYRTNRLDDIITSQGFFTNSFQLWSWSRRRVSNHSHTMETKRTIFTISGLQR